MLRKILINIGSGYLLKIVQIFCSLLTVPILIDSEGLGLAGYGQLAAALSISAMLSMAYDGIRLVTSKRIGQSKPAYSRETRLLSGYVVVTALPAAALLILLQPQIFAFAGLDHIDARVIYWIALTFIVEQTSYAAEQFFHSQLRTSLINIVNSVEVIVRLIAIALVFNSHTGSIEHYFIIFLSTSLCRITLLWSVILRDPLPDTPADKSTSLVGFVRESAPHSLNGIALFIVFRFSIILSNRYLSSELAAVFAILFFTIRGYLNQIFISVIRPMVIPLVSQIDLRRLEFAARQRYDRIVVTYELIVISAIFLIAFSCPLWLHLWLGDEFDAYRGIVGFGIAIMGIEAALSLKGMILVSQGRGIVLSHFSLIGGILYVIALSALRAGGGLSLSTLTFAVTLYILLYSGVVMNLLYSHFVFSNRRALLTLLIATAVSASQYGLLSSPESVTQILAMGGSIWILSTLALTASNLDTLRQLRATLKTLTL